MTKPSATGDVSQAPSFAKHRGLSLLLVQMSVCVIAVLCMFSLKLIGGVHYDQALEWFRLHTVLVEVPDDFNEESEPIFDQQAEVVSLNSDKATSSIPSPMVRSVKESSPFCSPLTGGVITSMFGTREDPFDSSVVKTHHGVDIAAVSGTPLAAMTAGTVTQVGYEEYGYGHYVIVQKNSEYSYIYAHCSEICVNIGDTVTAGDVIALVGNTGRSTGDHVHIEWRQNDTPIDPLTVLPKETYV